MGNGWKAEDIRRARQKVQRSRVHCFSIGIAADEPKRIKKLAAQKIAPLAEWGVTETDCLQGCYNRGYEWIENGFRLYDLLDRVLCWCCAN